MKNLFKAGLAALALLAAAHASAQITFYEHRNYEGGSFTLNHAEDDFRRIGVNDQASSVVVQGRAWEICEGVAFSARCVILRPGNYPSLAEFQLNNKISSAREAWGHGEHVEPPPPAPIPVPMSPQISFFEHDGFQGRGFTADQEVLNFNRFGFNDRASSVIVLGGPWEVCEHVDLGGRCMILRPGRYPDLGAMGMNDRLSSARPLRPEMRYDEGRYAPPPAPVYDWRRRPQERLFEVPVTAVHAVYAGPQQQHCWIEREQVVRAQPNAGGALIGGVIGGILGHQISGGRDLATVGGAVAGAAIGANAGRDVVVGTQGVQRCAAVPPQGRPDYWDVSYQYRGQEHHVQTTTPPGPTLTVNEWGEPRL